MLRRPPFIEPLITLIDLSPVELVRVQDATAEADDLLGCGEKGEAFRCLVRHRDDATRRGLINEALALSLALSNALRREGEHDSARVEAQLVAAQARQERRRGLEVQARSVLAAALYACGEVEGAIVGYLQCGRLALERGLRLHALDALQSAGQLLAWVGRDDEATNVFIRALGVGNRSKPQQSDLVGAADRVAALCRLYGLDAQAGGLELLAADMRTGCVGSARAESGVFVAPPRVTPPPWRVLPQ